MQIEPINFERDHTNRLEFEDVVEQYYRPLYQFAFSLTRSEADAGDLTQHTFYTWATKGEQLRDARKVKAWLFTTLHRSFLQTRRRENRFPHYELTDVESELPFTLPQELSRLDSVEVFRALERVDDLFRAPMSLFYLQDCPYREIARILDIPLGTVKSRIVRGISQLRARLTELEPVADPVAA